jgi:hypothetical protein
MADAKQDCATLIQRSRKQLREYRSQKHQHFDELNGLVERIVRQFREYLPKYRETKSGSRVVHHFNAPGTQPVSLEKEHGSRDHLPGRYANIAMDGIELLLDYLEEVCNEGS